MIGTRRIVEPTWLSPSSDQKGLLLRRISTVAFASGIRHRPSFQTRAG